MDKNGNVQHGLMKKVCNTIYRYDEPSKNGMIVISKIKLNNLKVFFTLLSIEGVGNE